MKLIFEHGPRVGRASRRFVVRAFWISMWIGCGGAFTNSADTADGGTGRSGGAGDSTGGSTGTGGTVESGGTSGTGGATGIGGAGGSGGVSGGAGTAGAGGAGGSAGHATDGGTGYRACDGPGQCVAIESSCCGTCGAPEVSAFVGVNRNYAQQYRSALCPVPVLCPACATGQNPNIAARCVAGQCEAFDVRQVAEYSACQNETDCELRNGLACCICGSSTGWVAVSRSGDAAIAKAECAPAQACADCLPVPPVNLKASCSSHICIVAQ